MTLYGSYPESAFELPIEVLLAALKKDRFERGARDVKSDVTRVV
jgi:hypothetical protein